MNFVVRTSEKAFYELDCSDWFRKDQEIWGCQVHLCCTGWPSYGLFLKTNVLKHCWLDEICSEDLWGSILWVRMKWLVEEKSGDLGKVNWSCTGWPSGGLFLETNVSFLDIADWMKFLLRTSKEAFYYSDWLLGDRKILIGQVYEVALVDPASVYF